jgi:hypothetical protein
MQGVVLPPHVEMFIVATFVCYMFILFFSNYTVYRRHSQHTHTHPYEYTHANPTLGASSRLGRQILKIDEVTTNASLDGNDAYHRKHKCS